jgi:L-fuculokinase
MNADAGPLIAVFDVGKTNAKLSLIDLDQGRETWSLRRPNNVVQGSAGRELDVAAIETWLIESLRAAPGKERIGVIVPIAHGAAAVLVDHAGEVLAAPDYEDSCFDHVSEEYAPLRDAYSLTFSPSLPQGLNLGRQLFYLQSRRPELFQRAARILLYPQYWAWRLSGVMAAEVTSLGTQLARKQGWARLMPPQRAANDRLGRVRATLTAATGIAADCEVACGIHDSNASYLRFLMDREREAFTVVSSGTWTIVMANRGDLRRLREERDMLANANAFGAPVATARYMGGREYEAIARSDEQPTEESVLRVLAKGAIALPSFASAGPYSGRKGRIEGNEGFDKVHNAALATVYSALMSSLLIESLGSAGEIFVDGPLARNPMYARLLAGCVPVGTVRTFEEGGGTRVAAHLAGLRAPAADVPKTVVPLRAPGLLDYQANWRHRLEER